MTRFVVPPKFWISIVFKFSWTYHRPKEIENNAYAILKLEGKTKHYGIFEKRSIPTHALLTIREVKMAGYC